MRIFGWGFLPVDGCVVLGTGMMAMVLWVLKAHLLKARLPVAYRYFGLLLVFWDISPGYLLCINSAVPGGLRVGVRCPRLRASDMFDFLHWSLTKPVLSTD